MKILSKLFQSAAMNVLARASKSGKIEAVVIEHELPGVTPEMIDWWWDNIRDTERYKLWHPTDHIAFEWIVPPEERHAGTIQKATEKITGIPLALNIRWEEADLSKTEFENMLAASVLSESGALHMQFQHEYETASYGTRMRSTFYVPKGVPWFFKRGLRKHNREEMANFSKFLPELYRKEHGG